MKRMTMKDLALVAFAGGLLAIEVAGLHAAAPTVLRTLAGVSGLRSLQMASRSARMASESMLNGFSTSVAQAAVVGAKGAVEGAAERVATVAPVTVRRASATAPVCTGYRYVVVVGDRGATMKALRLERAQMLTWRAETRAHARAIKAQRRAADAVRRAIEVTSEASAL